MNQLTLEQLFEFAKSSTLNDLPAFNEGERQQDMVNMLNMVLIELHARFNIKQNIVEVPLEKDKTKYNLLDYIK